MCSSGVASRRAALRSSSSVPLVESSVEMPCRWQNSMRSKICGIEQRLAQPDQHHVLGRRAGLAHQALEDVVGHVLLGLRVRLARAHRAVEIALGRGLDDVLHRQGVHEGAPRADNPTAAWRGSRPACDAFIVTAGPAVDPEDVRRQYANAALRPLLVRVNRRVESNHALEYAARLANELDLPLLCYEELDLRLSRTPTTASTPSCSKAFRRPRRRLKARGIGYCLPSPPRARRNRRTSRSGWPRRAALSSPTTSSPLPQRRCPDRHASRRWTPVASCP